MTKLHVVVDGSDYLFLMFRVILRARARGSEDESADWGQRGGVIDC